MGCEKTPVWVIKFTDVNVPVCSPHLGEMLERAVKAGRANFQILFITNAAGAKCLNSAGVSLELKAEASLGKLDKVIEERPGLRSNASIEVN